MLVNTLLAKVIGTQNERDLKKLRPMVAIINTKEPEISKLSDTQLKERTEQFRQRLAAGETLDEHAVEPPPARAPQEQVASDAEEPESCLFAGRDCVELPPSDQVGLSE